MAQQYVIWSEEHGRWWAGGGWGYAPSLRKAGRYSKDAADRIVARANRVCRPPDFNEIALPDPLAQEASDG